MTNHHGVVHFEISADEPEKLADFYIQLFGWKVEKMPMGEMDYWVMMTGPADANGMPSEPGYIGGGLTKRMMPEQRVTNYVNVESVDEYLQKAKQLGAQEVMGKSPVPNMGWFAIVTDPGGNHLGIWQTDDKAAP